MNYNLKSPIMVMKNTGITCLNEQTTLYSTIKNMKYFDE